jgi:hypothetical protein
MITKNIQRPLLFLAVLALCLTLTVLSPTIHAAVGPDRLLTPATSAKNPNRLLITRDTGTGDNAAHALVTNSQMVQQLYYHVLSLPPAPTHEICPLYIIAEYQLTFFHNRTTFTKMSVLQGGCPMVILRSGAKRVPDDIFWLLLEQASDFRAKGQALRKN